jgi:hypothetical protein
MEIRTLDLRKRKETVLWATPLLAQPRNLSTLKQLTGKRLKTSRSFSDDKRRGRHYGLYLGFLFHITVQPERMRYMDIL